MEHPEHLLHDSVTEHWAAEHAAHLEALPDSRFAKHAKWLPMAAIAPAMMISALDMTTLNVALPNLTQDLNATTSDLQWIVDAYTIVFAGLLLFAQGLGDRFGRKGTFMTGLAVFMCASAAAAFTHTPPGLIGARAAMGVGAAMMMSPTLAMIAVIYRPEDRPRAVAIWVTVGAVGIALGPIVAGLLVDSFGWQATFLINVPVIAVTLVLTAMWLPTSRKPGEVRLDVVGMLLSIIGLVIFLYGLIEGPEKGWLSASTLGAIGMGLLITAGFIYWELHSSAPMFDPRVFKIGGVQAGAGSLFAVYATLMGMLFLVPQYLQFVEGLSAAATGWVMLPFGIVCGIASQRATVASKRFGRETTVMGGMLIIAMGFVALCFVNVGIFAVLIGMAAIGLGFGFTIGPSTTLVVDALPIEKAGDGSSVNMLVRQVGSAFGVGLVGSIFAGVYANHITPALSGMDPSDAADATRSVQGAQEAAAKLSKPAAAALESAADSASLAATRAGLIVAGVIALIAATNTARARRQRAREERMEEAAAT